MSSNLPPGVTESMLPGNRPEDITEERFWNDFLEKAASVLSEADFTAIADGEDDEAGLRKAVLIAREMGYKQGMEDERTSAAMGAAYGDEEAPQ